MAVTDNGNTLYYVDSHDQRLRLHKVDLTTSFVSHSATTSQTTQQVLGTSSTLTLVCNPQRSDNYKYCDYGNGIVGLEALPDGSALYVLNSALRAHVIKYTGLSSGP